MGKSNFENLRVYQLAEQLADTIWPIVCAWQNLARDTIGKQLIRSTDSIGANIAEGAGRGSYQDNRRFIRLARGSLYETKHWLRRAYKRNLLAKEEVEKMRVIMDLLPAMLNAYLNSVGKMKGENAKIDCKTTHSDKIDRNKSSG